MKKIINFDCLKKWLQWFWKMIIMIVPTLLNDFAYWLQSFPEVITIIFLTLPFLGIKHHYFSLIYHEKQAFFIRKGIFYGIIINIILIAFIKRSFAICLFFNKIIAMNNCLCNFFAGFRFKLYYLNFTRVPSVLFL